MGNIQNRRNVLKTLALGSMALSSKIASSSERKKNGKQPNIVLILADDMGWSDLGCYGSEIATPNLDRLAKGGIRFTQFHNTAKCFPSRACLLTGLYAQQCNMDKKPVGFKNSVTLAELLRSAGYRTLMAGKHHSTDNPFDRGFDRYFGLRDGCCNYFNPGLPREGEGKPSQKRNNRYWCIDDKTYSPYTPQEKDFYTTDHFTKYALSYLNEYQREDKPFFLYLAYTAPHDPLMAWPDDIKKYEKTYNVGYEAIRNARYQRQRQMGLIDDRFPLSESTYPSWDSLSGTKKEEEARKMAVYAAMIDRMDRNIGKVLNKIKEMGEEDNTIVLFASDNGCSAEMVTKGATVPGYGEIGSMTRWASLGGNWANVCNVPFRFYKNYSHEGGICTPLIAHWPEGIKNAGRISHRLGHFIDIMPTVLDVSGAEYPTQHKGEIVHPFEGESLLPDFTEKQTDRKNPIFWKWSKGWAVRNNQWKLVSWSDSLELYNIDTDKTETRNVLDQNPDVVTKLELMHRAWLYRCNMVMK